jgi:hypothetical protein
MHSQPGPRSVAASGTHTCRYVRPDRQLRVGHSVRVAESDATLRELAERMLGRATPEAQESVGASFDDRVSSSLELLEHGERVVAFENLCQNLYEYGVPLSEDELGSIRGIAIAEGVPHGRWAFLSELVR